MTKRTEITIESHRLLVVRRHDVSVQAWCERCSAKVEMITPHQAAAMAGVSPRTIYRWIEDARLHFTEEGGHVFVCGNSLQVNSGGLAEPLLESKDSVVTGGPGGERLERKVPGMHN